MPNSTKAYKNTQAYNFTSFLGFYNNFYPAISLFSMVCEQIALSEPFRRSQQSADISVVKMITTQTFRAY